MTRNSLCSSQMSNIKSSKYILKYLNHHFFQVAAMTYYSKVNVKIFKVRAIYRF